MAVYQLREQDEEREIIVVAWIVVLAIALRILALAKTDPVAFDSGLYFEIADLMLDGSWANALSYDYPPLYPTLIAALRALGLRAEIAGLLISFLSGLLIIAPLLAVARFVVGPAAWGAIFLWAIHPIGISLSVHALTDTPTALFVTLALWAGLRATREWRLAWALGAGALSGLAYLLRPEGIEPTLGLACLYGFLTGPWHQEPEFSLWRGNIWGRRTRKWIVWMAAPLIGWGVVAAPYLFFISFEAGSFTFSKKKSVSAMSRSLAPKSIDQTGGADKELTNFKRPTKPGIPQRSVLELKEDGPGWLSSVGRNIYEFQKPLVNGVFPVVLIFAFLSVPALRTYPMIHSPPACWLLIGVTGLHLMVLVALSAVHGLDYLGGHHFSLIMLYLLPFAGAGLAGTLNWIRDRIPAARWVTFVVVGGLIVSPLPKLMLRDPGRGSLLLPAATWLREQAPSHLVVVTQNAKLTYHARAIRLPLQGRYEDIMKMAKANKANFVAFYVDKLESYSPDFRARLNSGDLELATEFTRHYKSKFERFQIYRVVDVAQ